jgi:thiamine biosynthesis lipoprotein ApbE
MDHVIKDVQNVLGTFVTVTVVHPDVEEKITSLGDAFGEIRRMYNLMSFQRQNGEVGVLNRRGFYEDLSDDTEHVVQRGNTFSELSDGAFDITFFMR